MDGVSAFASIVAVVQAGDMLLQVGKAFHQTFISKESNDRAKYQDDRVATIEEFIQKIQFFEDIKVQTQAGTQSTTPNSTNTGGNAPQFVNSSGLQLDELLKKCRDHLTQLRDKTGKMVVPSNASKRRRFIGYMKQAINQSEFVQVDSEITCMLQELSAFISLRLLEASQLSNHKHDKITNLYQTLDERITNGTNQGVADHETLLGELGKVLDSQLELKSQISAFEQSQDMLLSRFERLSISSRLERSYSGTTAASEIELPSSEDMIAPIAPGLIKHPGYGFREDRLDDPIIDRTLVAHVSEWLGLEGHTRPLLCIRTVRQDDSIHDLCNRVIREIAGSGRWLLCYNGFPRDGPAPEEGWYTMTHVVWWLSGQLLIPVPHLDGHMPCSGYTPDLKAISERMAKKGVENTVFVVLYLLNRSCSTQEDEGLYMELIDRLHSLTNSTDVRLLIFTDDIEDMVAKTLPTDVIFSYPSDEQDGVSLVEWEVCWSDDESNDDESERGAMLT